MMNRISDVKTPINLHTSSHSDGSVVFILQDMDTIESEDKYGKHILEETGINSNTK
jgi:hypothetical protein